jgi:hypothetical protein
MQGTFRGAAFALGLAATAAFAGDAAHHDAEMAEYMNCTICKHMMVQMETLGPVMKHEMIAMDDGLAMYHWVTDDTKAALLHEVTDKMHAAGMETKGWTEAQAKDNLCKFCEGFHGLLAAGAHMSKGRSTNGDLMVITSDDPAVQAKIAAYHKEMAAEMGG